MSSLAAGMAIGVVGDAGVRANAQQPGMPNNGCGGCEVGDKMGLFNEWWEGMMIILWYFVFVSF